MSAKPGARWLQYLVPLITNQRGGAHNTLLEFLDPLIANGSAQITPLQHLGQYPHDNIWPVSY